MKVTVAKTAGFCFGVERAVDEVRRQIEVGAQPVCTLGPVIHNEQVMEDLRTRGVRVIDRETELAEQVGGTLVIRAHGIPRAQQERLEASGMQIVDATCPFVKKIHEIVEKKSKEGYTILIAGDPDHPEVRGIRGWASGPVYIIETPEQMDALTLPEGTHCILVSQTTFHLRKFQNIVELFTKKRYYDSVVNTVCSATAERQLEARRIASEVDAMLVIGGRHSSNTQKLYEICRANCTNTYFIETLADLETLPFQSFCHVGITAGASTPKKIIEEVTEKLCQN